MPSIDLRAILIVGMLLGGAVVAPIVVAAPHVCAWIKPLLHAATA